MAGKMPKKLFNNFIKNNNKALFITNEDYEDTHTHKLYTNYNSAGKGNSHL